MRFGHEIVSSAQISIRPYLIPDEKYILDNKTEYMVSMKSEPFAFSEYDEHGTPRIKISTAFIRDLDFITRSEIWSTEYDDPSCFIKYFDYITKKHPYPTMKPSQFAKKDTASCPLEGFSLLVQIPDANETLLFNEEYIELRKLNMGFVLLHEIYHLQSINSRPNKTFQEIRSEEIKAGLYAGQFVSDLGINPMLLLPALALISKIENKDRDPRHPRALDRFKNLKALLPHLPPPSNFDAFARLRHDQNLFVEITAENYLSLLSKP
jgi:hypothetical protein